MSAPTNRTVNIYINNSAGLKALDALQGRATKLRDAIRKGEAAGKDMTKAIAELGNTKDKISQLEQVLQGKLAPTLNMLRTRAAELARELKNMSSGDAGFAEKQKQYELVNNEFKRMQAEIKGVGTVMDSAKTKTSEFWKSVRVVSLGTIIGGFTQAAMQSIGSYISGLVSGNARLSDSLSDIRKTTGLTEEAVLSLNSSLGKLDTRTATKDLRDIAIGLGQIGEAATPEAVAAIDKIVVALGDEFGGGAQQITTTLGILRNNLQDLKTKDYGADVLSIGNALNVLGATGLATAPVVVDFANRMSGVAGTFKLTSGQILGMAATLQELGIEVERGSTAIVKIFQKIAAEPAKFARVAGIELEKFKELINTDMLGAFNALAIGAGKASGKNTEFARILKDLDTDGSGAGEVLSKLAKNQELLAGKVSLASEALQETSSITEEFDVKNTNMAANLAKLEKVFAKFITSPGVNNFLGNAVTGAIHFIEALAKVAGFVQVNISAFALWALAYVAQAGYVKQLVAWLAAQVGATNGATAAQVLATVAAKADIVATSALGVVKAALTLNMKRLRQEWMLMSAALGLNPWAAVLIAAGALLIGLNALIGKTKEFSHEQKRQADLEKQIADSRKSALDDGAVQANRLRFLYEATQNLNAAESTRIQAAKELQKLYPETFKNFTTEAILAGKAEAAYKGLTQAIIARSKVNAAHGELDELAKEERKVRSDIERETERLNIIEKHNKELQKLGADGSQSDSRGADRARANLAQLDTYLKNIADRQKKIAEQLAPGAPAPEFYAPPEELSDKEKNRLQRLAEQREEFLRKLQQLSDQAEAAEISKDEAEIQRVRNKYAELEVEAEKLFQGLSQLSQINHDLTEAQLSELNALYKKHFDKRSEDEYDATVAKVKAHFDIERQGLDKLFLDSEISQQQHSDRMLTLEEEEYDARAQVAEDYAATVQKAEQAAEKFKDESSARRVAREKRERDRNNQESIAGFTLKSITAPSGSKTELDAKKAELQARFDLETEAMDRTSNMYLLKQAELNNALRQLDRDYMLSKIQIGLETAAQLQGLYANYMASVISKMQSELDSDRAANDKKRKNYDKQLESKRISKAEYDRRIEKMEAEQAKKELAIRVKQFNAEKQMKIIQAGMDLASGVMNIWSKHAANPVMAGILTGILSVIGTINIGMIAAAEPPKYKRGRPPKGKGGVPEGPDHSQGGIKLIDSLTGMTVGEMEGNEPILSVDTYNNNPELIDALVDSSMNHGGRRIAMPWIYQQSPRFNTGRAVEAMQYNRMYSAPSARAEAYTTSGTYSQTALDKQSIEVLTRLADTLQDGIRGYVYYNDIDKSNKEITDLKRRGSSRP